MMRDIYAAFVEAERENADILALYATSGGVNTPEVVKRMSASVIRGLGGRVDPSLIVRLMEMEYHI